MRNKSRPNEDRNPFDDGSSATSPDGVPAEPAEVESVRARLAVIPPEWLDQDTVDGYLAQARAQAAVRSVSDIAVRLEAERDQLMNDLAAGLPVAEQLIESVGHAAAARVSANMFNIVDLPFEVGEKCIEHASRALGGLTADVLGNNVVKLETLNATDALSRYHQALLTGQQPDPPIYTTEERAISLKLEHVQRRLTDWHQHRTQWRATADQKSGSVINLLGAAVGLLEQLGPVLQEVDEVNERVRQANANRQTFE